jgi:acetyl esterase/lipase
MTKAAQRRRPPDPSAYWTVLNPELQTADWRAFYADADAKTERTRASLSCELDVPYGDDDVQRLDVYTPRGASDGGVLVFVHGGGFREGDRAHYGYVAAGFAEHGIVTVVPGYRMLPGATYFETVDDLRCALAWVGSHLASTVKIAGHSAGGVLAAFLGADRSWLPGRGLPADFVGAFAGISAGYDFTNDALPSYARSCFVDDDERRRASPVFNIRDPAPRALVAIGEREEKYRAPSRVFAEALVAAGVATDYFEAPGLGHDGTVDDLGASGTEMFERTLHALWGV